MRLIKTLSNDRQREQRIKEENGGIDVVIQFLNFWLILRMLRKVQVEG